MRCTERSHRALASVSTKSQRCVLVRVCRFGKLLLEFQRCYTELNSYRLQGAKGRHGKLISVWLSEGANHASCRLLADGLLDVIEVTPEEGAEIQGAATMLARAMALLVRAECQIFVRSVAPQVLVEDPQQGTPEQRVRFNYQNISART